MKRRITAWRRKAQGAGAEKATYAAFKLNGDMVVNPVDEAGESDPWTTSDKVDVSFKLTFTPQMATGK